MGAAIDSELRMSLAEHLRELRKRLWKCTLAILGLGTISLAFARPIFGALMLPVLEALPPDARSLVYTSGIEEINVLMKVGLYCGIFLSTPVILWQLWGFVSPGLYETERKFASPFVVLGSLAFVAGATFCYFVVLPSMFQFLLREGDSAALEQRLDVSALQREEALRFLRIGEVGRAGSVAKAAIEQLDGAAQPILAVLPGQGPQPQVEVQGKLDALGALIDSAEVGLGSGARVVLRDVMELRLVAIDAFSKEQFALAAKKLDEAAARLASAAPTRADELGSVWKLQKELASGKALHQAQSWTRPMLTMHEQLSLVLLLELAFGIIFELPLVMALLGVVGLVSSKFLFRYQRHAFVVCMIAGAIITPTGDAVNLLLMSGPMLLCFELGVLAVWLIEKRRPKPDPDVELSAE